jgi:hypothetical protein
MSKNQDTSAPQAICDTLTGVLNNKHSKDYTFEGFINVNVVEIWAFNRLEAEEKGCLFRVGVNSGHKQFYISNIFMFPGLTHQGIGKKLIRIVFEIGHLFDSDVFLVQLTDSFKDRMLKRGALETNEFDTLQIVESTRLID